MSETTIKCNPNGPLLVQGPATLLDAEGHPFELKGKQKYALCRCTKSGNQPFCDGTHNGCGFEMQNIAPKLTDDAPQA